MANTVQIDVITTADTKGIQDVDAAFRALKDGMSLKEVNAQLAQQGLQLDVVKGKLVQIKDSAVASTAATKEMSTGMNLFQINTSKALGEFQVLVREMATGSVHARTIGSLLSALGPAITGLGIGAILLFEQFNRINKEMNQWVDSLEKADKELRKIQQTGLELEDSLRETLLLKKLPLEDALVRAQADVTRLREEQALVNRSTIEGAQEYDKITQNLRKAEATVEHITKQEEHRADVVRETKDATELLNAAGNEQLKIDLQVQQAFDRRLRILREAKVDQDVAVKLAIDYANAERKSLEATQAKRDTQKDLTDELKKAQMALEAIRESQKLIAAAPFLGIDARTRLELQTVVQELQNLKTVRDSLISERAGLIDPVQIDRVNQEIQKTDFNIKKLGLDIIALQHPIQASLQQWANSFGSVSTQIAKTIEGSINAALQEMNNWIITGKFNAQALEESLVRLGLQLIEQILIQQAVSLINNALAASQAKVLGTSIALSMAPAATAATIATEGAAAAQAPFAIAGALAASLAAFGVAHGGGRLRRFHGGGLAPDEIPIVAQEGEFVINRASAQRIGYSFLEGLNRMHPGGMVYTEREGRGITPMSEFHGILNYPTVTVPPPPSVVTISPGVTVSPPPGFVGFDPRTYDITRGPTFTSPISWPGAPIGGITVGGSPVMITGGLPIGLGGGGRGGYPAIKYLHGGGRLMHNGGSVGGGGGGGGIHIYAFTDLRALTRHMASKEGQKIIFDTVRGRRIDLGMR